MNFREYIEKKDKSTLIGQLFGLLLLLVLFFIVLWEETADGKLLGFSILIAGIALGWATGILLSPQSEFNDEAAKFTKVQSLIATFITGALAVKLLPFITQTNLERIAKDYLLLSRIFYFTGAFIISAIIIYYDRVYLGDQDVAKLSLRRRDMLPESNIIIPIRGINDDLKVTFHNRGSGELQLSRSSESGTNPGPFPVEAGKCYKTTVKDLGDNGDNLVIFNPDKANRGKFKLRIS